MRPDRSPLPTPPPLPGRVLDARLHLLDRQILDAGAMPVATVDDLDVEIRENTPTGRIAVVTGLLTGPVLATRILGGHQPSARRWRIPWSVVTAVDAVVRVRVAATTLEATWPERWLRDHLVSRIPGGRHVPG